MITTDEESERLNALYEYEILDTEEEQELNELTQLAALICNTPIALISLIDKDRQWFKAKHGIDVSETERSIAFCNFTIAQNDVFEVSDTQKDERFSQNPLVVGSPRIRFYSGAPLVTEEGYKVGSLCVVDRIPKQLTLGQKGALEILSKQVTNSFELRRSRKKLEKEKNLLEEKVRERTAELTAINYKLNQILELVPHPIFLKDSNGKYLLINKAQTELFETTPENIIGKDDSTFLINKEEMKLVEETDAKVLELQETVTISEQIITTPNNRKKVLFTTKVPFRSINDNEPKILGVSIDLTALKEVEKAKEESDSAYKKLVELSPDTILIHDENTVLFVNPAGIKLLGANSESDIAGKSILNYIRTDQRNIFLEAIIHGSEQDNNMVANLVSLKNENLIVEVKASSFYYQKKLVKQIIFRDITLQLQASEQLLKSKEEFKALTENSPDYISRVNTRLEYLYMNQTHKNGPFPYCDDYLGKTPRQLQFPASICSLLEFTIQEIIHAKKAVTRYFEITDPDYGKYKFNYMTCIPEFNQEQIIVSVLIIVRDITELKKNELNLIKANQELDRFVYSASHELRAPLKSVLGLTRVAWKDFNLGNFEYKDHYFKRIESSIVRLDKLVNDIIDYSRNARLSIHRELIDFKAMIESLFENMKYLEKIPVEKYVTIQEDVPFYSDENRVCMILNNLICNSLKFADSSKENSFLKMNITVNKENCTLEITDNGIGIEEVYIDKVFEMFFRASVNSDGAGLGMYIVKETVNKLGGNIKIDSSINIGTKVKIELPNI